MQTPAQTAEESGPDMRKRTLLFIISAVICCSGCAPFSVYIKDRGLDFIDCFRADIGVGIGVDVHVKVADLISLGFGVSGLDKVGMKGRHVGRWKDVHASLLIIGFVNVGRPVDEKYIDVKRYLNGEIIEYKRTHIVGGYQTISYMGINSGPLILPGFFSHESPPAEPLDPFEDMVNAFDVEVGATAGVVGVRLGFSFGQFLDFITGWFGADIAKDDTYYWEWKYLHDRTRYRRWDITLGLPVEE